MSDHEIMGSSQRGERGDSDADVPFLYFGVWFLASFEQGVAAQCSDDLHVVRETVSIAEPYRSLARTDAVGLVIGEGDGDVLVLAALILQRLQR